MKEKDIKEKDWKETDLKKTDWKETNSKETDSKETNSKETDSKETDWKETDWKETDLEESCLHRETIFQGKIITVHHDTVLLPGGRTSVREIVQHPGAVAIVACRQNEILMVKQYRYALKRETLEIPAGKLDPGEKPETCALRELREETGYSGELSYLGTYYTSPGFTDEAISLYYAEDLTWAPLQGDEDEFLHVVRLSWTEALQKVRSGQIQDGKTVLGILLAKEKFGL